MREKSRKLLFFRQQKNSQPIGTPFKRPAWRNSLAIAPWGSEKASVIFWDVSACVAGGYIDEIYPQDLKVECECRKPKPGMLLRGSQN